MKLTITHTTSYSYDSPDHYTLQQLRLTPKSGNGQTVLEWNVTVNGGSKQLSFDDQHCNHVDLVLIDQNQSHVTITSSGTVEVEDRAGIIGRTPGFAPLWLFLAATPSTTPGPRLRKLVNCVKQSSGESDIERMHRLSAAILDGVAYRTGRTDATTTAEGALDAGQGVCQDHAQIMITAARLMGFPARYVSGYLMMDDVDQQEATHAWCEVWVDPMGWVGFDVSNGISPDGRYVRLATGRDYAEAAPIHGLRQGGGSEDMQVALKVQQQTDQ